MSSREIIRRLGREGWVLARTTGSHHHFVHPSRPGERVTVPHPRRDVAIGTLRSIARQARWEDV